MIGKPVVSDVIVGDYAITIHVDAARLPTDEAGHISKEKSISYLTSWADRLRLHDLAGTNGAIDLDYDYSWIEGKQYLSDLLGTEYESSMPSQLQELMTKEPRVAQWATRVEIKSMNNSPFTAVFYDAESRGDFVEIHSQELYPSPSTIAQEGGFHNQLSKKISEKMDGGQFERGFPVVIAVKEDIGTKMFFDCDFEETGKVNNVIKSELANSPWISGIILYTRTIVDGRYIENTKAEPSLRLTQDELAAFSFAE